jgi:acetyl esterase/lipase
MTGAFNRAHPQKLRIVHVFSPDSAMKIRLLLLFTLLFTLFPALVSAAPMKLADYMALSGPAPVARLAYGPAPSQYAELFLPGGTGPFPVAVLVHGGCWTGKFGGITQLRSMAGALVERGIAVWNVEYRRVDEPGGGYPGMYEDMHAALDSLAAQAGAHRLDLDRVVAVGHSAGGQLVQWIAGRARIPASSPLHRTSMLPVRAVVSLGGLADLRRERALIKANCGRDTPELAGRPSAARPDVYVDTNPAELMPNGSHTILVTGELDTISPPRVAHDYAARARAAGDSAEVVILPGASHYDEVAASSPSWPLVAAAIERALAQAASTRALKAAVSDAVSPAAR